MFLTMIDDAGLRIMLDHYYDRLMDRTITLEERALYYELYEALTIEKTNRAYER
jgi:hypothetical protein